jgi:hypothetical protein
MGLGICLRSCPPIQASPESPPLLRYTRYPTPSLVVLMVLARRWLCKLSPEGSYGLGALCSEVKEERGADQRLSGDMSVTRCPSRMGRATH